MDKRETRERAMSESQVISITLAVAAIVITILNAIYFNGRR
jgi:hypothetical protein